MATQLTPPIRGARNEGEVSIAGAAGRGVCFAAGLVFG
jgi:hypothetical protein